ncbi:MAG: zinc ribbon domain-containing protein, partial [Methanomicrobiales archaeon]|nr:zinc ribbon domain-containing protein [Methanomicrobiales archaeon]
MSVARFWRKIPQRYNLIGTRCETCGTYFFPPRT